MHESGALAIPGAGEERVGVHLGLHGVAVEEALLLAQPLDLVRFDGHRQLAGALEVHVEGVPRDGLLDAVEVLAPEFLEAVDLVGPARQAVLVSVREAGLAEAAVATGGRPRDAGGLEQHDTAIGVALLGADGGPQPRVAAADDREVGGDGARQHGMLGALHIVEPEHVEDGVAQRPLDRDRRGKTALEDGGSHDHSRFPGPRLSACPSCRGPCRAPRRAGSRCARPRGSCGCGWR
ncbi:hypothetical protein SRABI03_03047 [Microbacterium foliorum]|nr:hypothetical protein SRABI03_03047 [Microbacterium foliorum]